MILEQKLLPSGVETTTRWNDGKLFEISYSMPRLMGIDTAKNFQLATDSVIYRTLQEIDSRTRCKFELPEILGVEVKNDPETMDSQYDEDGKYQKPIAEMKKSEQAEKERHERLAAKRAKRMSKRENKKREREISIQAEAYARAMRTVKREETM